MREFLLAILFLLLLHPLTMAQEVDTIVMPQDTSIQKEKQGFFKWLFAKDNYPEPRKALFLSLVLPGSGQVYNKRYWKVPIVYGAIGGLYLVADFNRDRYLRFKEATELKVAGEEHEFTNTNLDDLGALRNLRDGYRKDMEAAYIFMTLAYMLNGIDAFVDAHLLTFDVDDDLSLRLKTSLEPMPYAAYPAFGLGVQLQFHKVPQPTIRRIDHVLY